MGEKRKQMWENKKNKKNEKTKKKHLEKLQYFPHTFQSIFLIARSSSMLNEKTV